jgi:hypothetical protein
MFRDESAAITVIPLQVDFVADKEKGLHFRTMQTASHHLGAGQVACAFLYSLVRHLRNLSFQSPCSRFTT